jgi:hypothetical protein
VFKIKTRITNDIEELKTMTSDYFDKEWNNIGGFIEIDIGGHKEGCYFHEKPLQDGELGGELVNWWIELFLNCAIQIQKTNYVAFHEPETTHRWLEFKLVADNVIINVAVDTKLMNRTSFFCENYDGFIYEGPKNYSISLEQFTSEVYAVTRYFLDELKIINPDLLNSQMAINLLSLSNELSMIAN